MTLAGGAWGVTTTVAGWAGAVTTTGSGAGAGLTTTSFVVEHPSAAATQPAIISLRIWRLLVPLKLKGGYGHPQTQAGNLETAPKPGAWTGQSAHLLVPAGI
jgi:hypothetical protein